MDTNQFSAGGRPAYTDDEMRDAREWLQKALELEKQYQKELHGAGTDPYKKNEAIKQIYDELGPVPRLVSQTLMASYPIVVLISQYEASVKNDEAFPAHTSAGPWTCSICRTENQGNFCMTCGAKRP